jgi:hypothetical protein
MTVHDANHVVRELSMYNEATVHPLGRFMVHPHDNGTSGFAELIGIELE